MTAGEAGIGEVRTAAPMRLFQGCYFAGSKGTRSVPSTCLRFGQNWFEELKARVLVL